MITLEQIKSDLREIRYYYLRKEKLDDASYSIGSIPIKELLENYNCVIREAPLKLYDLYACLYIRGQTQEDLASELAYSPQYLRKLISQLYSYFKTKFNEKETRNGTMRETAFASDSAGKV